jgi:3'(2'), 5'-bisphosphate nucleotidase
MLQNLNLETLKDIAYQAGDKILEIYHNADFSQVVDFKTDNSPLTLADKASHNIIVPDLQHAYPDIPIISEEGKDIPYETRKNWEYFWLVDPLDGTKEFIKRNGQFTVNIALIHYKRPVFGIVHTPVPDEMYYGFSSAMSNTPFGAYKQTEKNAPVPIAVSHKKENRIAVRSSSHAAPEEETLLAQYGVTQSISKGSALKFCMVAEAKADIYYRHGPTMEWDTAAGQAVVEAAGGKVYSGNTEENIFTYNKESLLNSSFLVLGF